MTARSQPRDLGEVLRDEIVERDRVAGVLHEGPLTIPEIAKSLDVPTVEAMKWVMAMRRYGRVRELPKARADDYYRYEMVEVTP